MVLDVKGRVEIVVVGVGVRQMNSDQAFEVVKNLVMNLQRERMRVEETGR
jgi:hypothetical protein